VTDNGTDSIGDRSTQGGGVGYEQKDRKGHLRSDVGEVTVTMSGELKWQEAVQEGYVTDFNGISPYPRTE